MEKECSRQKDRMSILLYLFMHPPRKKGGIARVRSGWTKPWYETKADLVQCRVALKRNERVTRSKTMTNKQI